MSEARVVHNPHVMLPLPVCRSLVSCTTPRDTAVAGVSEARVVHNPHVTLPSPRKFLFLCGVTPFREHYTPSDLGQVLWSGVIVLCPSGWVMR